MRRLLAIATSALLLAACGGPVVTGPVGTARDEMGPVPPELTEVPVLSVEYLDLPELVLEVPGVAFDIQELEAPPVEERFFYTVLPTLKEMPALPAPPCPACLR